MVTYEHSGDKFGEGISMRKYLSIFILGIVLWGLIFINLGCGGSSVPIQSHIWRDDGTGTGFIQFYTNDPNEYNYNFLSWTSTPQAPMISVETQVKKISGNQNYGYGVLYCYQDSNNFYCLLITVNKYYCVYKRVDGIFSPVLDWRYSSNLYSGYDILNKIKINLSTTTPNSFTVYFNDIEDYTFIDSSFTSGDSGFYTTSGKSNEENFPNVPVDVRFKQITPAFSLVSIKNFNETTNISNGSIPNYIEKAY